MRLYAIRHYVNNVPVGYYIGPHGPVTFTKLTEAQREAEHLVNLTHTDYRAEEIKD